MKKLLHLFLTVILTGSAAFAWGPQGHMMVASVAWKQLNPDVKKEITRLLKLNPNYESWVEGVAAADADGIAFITAATWPDFIKGAEGYVNDGEHPTSPDAADNTGYDDKLQHRYWHFFDTPFAPDGTLTHPADSVNAVTQIRMFTRAIKLSQDDSVRSYDIVWLEHMVGDVHQPLHATSRFDIEDPQGDNGANRVHVCSPGQAFDPKKCKTTLHSVWDGLLGSGESVTTAQTHASSLPSASTAKAADLEPAHWVTESSELAESKTYHTPVDIGDGPFVLDAAYRAAAKVVADQQVALAGARLANLLNANVAVGR